MKMKKGLHGGTVSTIELKLNISKDLNGAVYTCQAMNEAIQRSVHDALTLKVLCEYINTLREGHIFSLVGFVLYPTKSIIRSDVSTTIQGECDMPSILTNNKMYCENYLFHLANYSVERFKYKMYYLAI